MIQNKTRKKCGNCRFFQLSRPATPTSKTTYNGRCTREDWPHATTVGKRACPGFKARESEQARTDAREPVQRVHALIWQAFGALAEHRYSEAASALECAASELRKLIARREVRKCK